MAFELIPFSTCSTPPDVVARREMEAAGHRKRDIRMVVDMIRCDMAQEAG